MKPRASLHDGNHHDCDQRSHDFEVRAEAKWQEYMRAQQAASTAAATLAKQQAL